MCFLSLSWARLVRDSVGIPNYIFSPKLFTECVSRPTGRTSSSWTWSLCRGRASPQMDSFPQTQSWRSRWIPPVASPPWWRPPSRTSPSPPSWSLWTRGSPPKGSIYGSSLSRSPDPCSPPPPRSSRCRRACLWWSRQRGACSPASADGEWPGLADMPTRRPWPAHLQGQPPNPLSGRNYSQRRQQLAPSRHRQP